MKRDIAVVVLGYIQFVNIYPGLKRLMDEGYSVDFYSQDISWNKEGYNEMFADSVEIMKNNKLRVYTKPLKCEYKVLLEPYPCNMEIKHKYRIKYRYSNISAKPSAVYQPRNYLMYDAVLCSGKYDSNYLKVFSMTYETGNLKYHNFKRKNGNNKHGKKVLLYLPTYGNESSIDDIIDELANLRKEYYIIAKIHHGTSFLHKEKERTIKLQEQVDEFYDLHKDLPELLSVADVVLTDNSGSIFEALYTGVPVAVFADDINKNKLDTFNTTQFELHKEGILPYTNKKQDIIKVLKEAQSSKIFKLQQEWSKTNFFFPTDPAKSFADVIKQFINDDNINKRYLDMHNVLKHDYYSLLQTKEKQESVITGLETQINELNQTIETKNNNIDSMEKEAQELNNKIESQENKIASLESELGEYKKGKLYRLAQKIYTIKGRAHKWKRKK